MALYEIQYRGASPDAQLKSALVFAPNAIAALDDVAHPFRPEDREGYRVRRLNTAARRLLFTTDEY